MGDLELQVELGGIQNPESSDFHARGAATHVRNFKVRSRDFVRAGLQTRARFTITECLSVEPVRRIKLETVGRLVNAGRLDYRARVWRPARTSAQVSGTSDRAAAVEIAGFLFQRGKQVLTSGGA